MSRRWQHHNTDNNQKDIVDELRQLPGIGVETGHDDILVGYLGLNYWFEIKNPDEITKDKRVRKSGSKQTRDKQKKLETKWQGQYQIVWTTAQILETIGYPISLS